MLHLAHPAKPLSVPLVIPLAERFHPRVQPDNLAAFTKPHCDLLLLCLSPGVATQHGGYHMFPSATTNVTALQGRMATPVEQSHLRQAASSRHKHNHSKMRQAHSQAYRAKMAMGPRGDEHASRQTLIVPACSPALEPKPKEVHKLISSSAQRCSIPLLGPRDPARAMALPGFGWAILRTTGKGMVTAPWERMSHGPLSVTAQPVEATGTTSSTPSAYSMCHSVSQAVRQRGSKLQAAYLFLSRSDECAASVCNHACEMNQTGSVYCMVLT